MKNKLKPCPFCGGEAGVFEIKGIDNDLISYIVGCLESSCKIRPSVQRELDKQGVIDLWNRRSNNDR